MNVAKKNFVFFLTLIAIFGVSRTASADPRGPSGKKFGAGIFIGDPTGFTLKGYVSPKVAMDGYFSWSFAKEAFVLIGDVTYEILEIPVDTQKITLPFYAGIGSKIAFDKGGKNNRRTVAGIRIPVGISAQFVKYPVEIFLEAAPGVDVTPGTELDITGGIGARYYFF